MKSLYLILTLIIAFSLPLEAQEVVRSTIGVSGSTSESSSKIVQQSIGQSSVIGTVQQSTLAVRQGFIQPPVSVESILINENTLNVSVFPNPVKSALNVRFLEEISGTVNFEIYDMLGRVIMNTSKNASQNMVLDMSTLSSAKYVLLISLGKKQLKANLLKR